MRTTSAGPSIEQIIGWAASRAKAQGQILGDMRRVKDTYGGKMVIALPDMDRDEDPAVANIIAQSIDQYAGRIASTLPNVYFPSLRPGINKSENLARDRWRVTSGLWKWNRMPARLRQRAYDITGYSFSPVSLSYAQPQNCAKWTVRDPLNTFPQITNDPNELTPPNCIFKFKRSYGWLKDNYQAEIANLNVGDNPDDTMMFDIIEYQDDEVLVQCVLGVFGDYWAPNTGDPFCELMRLPNKAGVCLVVTAGKIGLTHRKPQFLDAIGIYKAQARMVALEMIAVERGIFPDTYLVSRPGGTGKFVSGPHDGRTGMVNVVQDADVHQTVAPLSGNANMMSSNLERAARISSGTSSDTQGEGAVNTRTGKRGDAILAAVIDIPIQAAQEALAESLEQENKRAIAIQKAYGGSRTTTFYFGNGAKAKQIVFKPNEVFETDQNTVSFSYAGADANGLVVALGQRLSIGTISKKTAMEVDPFVEDVILELETIQTESLQTALLAAIDQQAQAGTIPPHDLAAIGISVMSGKTLFEAVDAQQKAAQQRQATLADAAGPGQTTAPEAQPGLAIPGQGAEQPSINPPSQSQVNLNQMLRTVQGPANVARQDIKAGA